MNRFLSIAHTTSLLIFASTPSMAQSLQRSGDAREESLRRSCYEQSNIHDCGELVKYLRSETSRLKTKIDDLDRKIPDADRVKRDLDTELANLPSKIQTLEAEIRDLPEQIRRLESDRDTLRSTGRQTAKRDYDNALAQRDGIVKTTKDTNERIESERKATLDAAVIDRDSFKRTAFDPATAAVAAINEKQTKATDTIKSMRSHDEVKKYFEVKKAREEQEKNPQVVKGLGLEAELKIINDRILEIGAIRNTKGPNSPEYQAVAPELSTLGPRKTKIEAELSKLTGEPNNGGGIGNIIVGNTPWARFKQYRQQENIRKNDNDVAKRLKIIDEQRAILDNEIPPALKAAEENLAAQQTIMNAKIAAVTKAQTEFTAAQAAAKAARDAYDVKNGEVAKYERRLNGGLADELAELVRQIDSKNARSGTAKAELEIVKNRHSKLVDILLPQARSNIQSLSQERSSSVALRTYYSTQLPRDEAKLTQLNGHFADQRKKAQEQGREDAVSHGIQAARRIFQGGGQSMLQNAFVVNQPIDPNYPAPTNPQQPPYHGPFNPGFNPQLPPWIQFIDWTREAEYNPEPRRYSDEELNNIYAAAYRPAFAPAAHQEILRLSSQMTSYEPEIQFEGAFALDYLTSGMNFQQQSQNLLLTPSVAVQPGSQAAPQEEAILVAAFSNTGGAPTRPGDLVISIDAKSDEIQVIGPTQIPLVSIAPQTRTVVTNIGKIRLSESARPGNKYELVISIRLNNQLLVPAKVISIRTEELNHGLVYFAHPYAEQKIRGAQTFLGLNYEFVNGATTGGGYGYGAAPITQLTLSDEKMNEMIRSRQVLIIPSAMWMGNNPFDQTMKMVQKFFKKGGTVYIGSRGLQSGSPMLATPFLSSVEEHCGKLRRHEYHYDRSVETAKLVIHRSNTGGSGLFVVGPDLALDADYSETIRALGHLDVLRRDFIGKMSILVTPLPYQGYQWNGPKVDHAKNNRLVFAKSVVASDIVQDLKDYVSKVYGAYEMEATSADLKATLYQNLALSASDPSDQQVLGSMFPTILDKIQAPDSGMSQEERELAEKLLEAVMIRERPPYIGPFNPGVPPGHR